MTNLLLLLAFSVLLLIPVGAHDAFATVWNLENDFSATLPPDGQGPFGAWFYRFEKTAGAVPNDGDYDPWNAVNPNFFGLTCLQEAGKLTDFFYMCENSPVLLHPRGAATGNPEDDVIVGFSSPQRGTYHVEGSFVDANAGGNGVCVSISQHDPANAGVLNSDQDIPGVFTSGNPACSIGSINGVLADANTNVANADFDFDVDLTCNETLYFRINPNTIDATGDATFLTLEINDVFLDPDPNDNCADPPSDEDNPVGGILLPVEALSLLVVGAQSFSWMIPVVLSGIGIGLFVFRKSSN